MNLENEVLAEIKKLTPQPIVIKDWEPIADILSNAFPWKGSKIAWKQLNFHIERPIDFNEPNDFSKIKSFLDECNALDILNKCNEIYYVNDSSLNFALSINPEVFFEFVNYAVNNIPQHHYFFDKVGKWCFAITSEGYLDFGKID